MKVIWGKCLRGKITMELQDAFLGSRFGIQEDKFGVNWMFNFDYPKEEK